MKRRNDRVRDEEVAEILRLGRLEDWALRIAIGAMVLIVLLALLLQFGGPVGFVAPIIGILCAVGIVAAAAWAIGNVRTSRALDRATRDKERKRRPVMLYALVFGCSIGVGVTYWFASGAVRELLWGAWAIAGVATFVWAQGRYRSQGKRRTP